MSAAAPRRSLELPGETERATFRRVDLRSGEKCVASKLPPMSGQSSSLRRACAADLHPRTGDQDGQQQRLRVFTEPSSKVVLRDADRTSAASGSGPIRPRRD